MKRIKIKYLQADFPTHVFQRFNWEKDEALILQMLFDDRNKSLVRLPFAPANEKFAKPFIHSLEIFANL